MTVDRNLTEALTSAAKEIHAASGMEETLDAIVRSARNSLPGIDHIGITVGHHDGRLETLASTDEKVLELDRIQYSAGEGPCIHAAKAETVIRVERARHEQRWPRFIPDAVAVGLRSMMGVRLHVDEVQMAALNLYSTSQEELHDDLEDFAELFATYASLALGRARREDQLNDALVSRRVIGQATGIVMERYTVDEPTAFRYLTRMSNDTNTRLRDLAAGIVADASEKAVSKGSGEPPSSLEIVPDAKPGDRRPDSSLDDVAGTG